MRKMILLVIAFLVTIPLLGVTLQYSKPGSDVDNIHFNLPEFAAESTLSDGQQVQKLKISTITEDNWQDNLSGLPQLEKWVYVPDGYDAQVTLENANVISKDNYTCDVVNTDFDTQDWLDVSQTVVFRGNRILSVCIKPFKYNTQSRQLSTLNQADIRVQFVPSDRYISNDRLFTQTTADMLKSICINRDEIRTTINKPGSYVIFYNGTSLPAIIQPLVDWKHQKGYEVHLVSTTSLAGGNTTTSIKSYLQTAYDTWANPPEYILLLGKATSGTYYVPTYTDFFNYNTSGDYKYTLLDGTDIVPDAYIGRITFASTDELQTAVNKFISYEKNQNLSPTAWLNKSFLLGDPYQSGLSCMTTMTYVKSLLQDYNPGVQLTEAYSGSFPSQISAALNAGVGTYWYRGHGEMSGWSNSDIANLNNSGKFPFISYITCFTGTFNNGSQISQAEKFMRVGTPTVPKGAIGVIGASCETHSCINNILTGGFAYGLYNEGLSQGGPALVRGKLALMANYPQNPADYLDQNFLSMNLFGDPGLNIWLKPITSIIVTGPPTLYPNGGNASVRVTLADNTPLEGVWVCLTKDTDDLFISGYTDINGMVILPYDVLTAGNPKLTATKPQYMTYQVNVAVNSSNQAITMQNIAALSQCYAGSTLTFPISLTNNSDSILTNVTAMLQSQNENITLTQAQSSFANIPAGEMVTSLSNFQAGINSEMPKGEAIYLNLHITHTGGIFDIPIIATENGPNFSLGTVAFGGNALNHGANQLDISIINNSQTAVTGIQAVLESTNPFLTIQNPNQILGNIAANATTFVPAVFAMQVADSLWEGVNVRLNLRLYNSSGFFQMLAIDKKVGTPTLDDITGPDAYGYTFSGPGDIDYKPYNWIEIDPTLGGTGTNLSLNDIDTEGSGDFATITVPFQFRFYGKSYTQLTLCSNGFIMPGSEGSIEWMNWEVPGPMVPRPLIAPFWDDLLTDNSSKVLYKYDSSLNAMVIQWQNLKNKYSPTLRETFQAILYDPAIQATPSGDSPMLFQYKVFNNVDGGNYGVDYIDHGQYATVGIADHTGLKGLSYTYNNQYPATAQLLTNLSTIYVTTLPYYSFEPNPVFLNYQITEVNGNGNGLPDAGELLNLNMAIKNAGLGTITDSQVTLSSLDEFVTITQNSASLPTLYSNQTAFTSPALGIQIAPNCPNLRIINFNLHIQNQEDQFDIPVEMTVHALQLDYSNLVITDSNNDFPEPGETVQITFNVNNISLLPAQNVVVSINHPDAVTVIPAAQTINIPPMASQSESFGLTLGNNIEQGSTIDLELHFVVAGIYEKLFSVSLLVGVPEVFLNTTFDEPDITTVIPFMYNVTISPAQFIHDSGNEAVMHFAPNAPYSYMFMNTIPGIDLLNARIKFTWLNTNPNIDFSLQVFYSDETTLSTVWNSTQISNTPQTTIVDLNGIPSTAEYLQLLFMGTINGTDMTPVIVDDVSILTMHHAPGFISGHVNLDLNPELVSQVSIVHRYSNVVFHPDTDGNFLIPAYQGQNVLYAFHENYINQEDSLIVQVMGGQTTSGSVFNLQKLCAPIDLTYALTGNTLNLTWNVEGQVTQAKGKEQTGKQDRYLTPDFYRIFFKCNTFIFQATSTTQSYSRVLNMNGNYQVYVMGVYELDEGEVLSDTTNVLHFAFTPNEDNQNVPIVFGLKQNIPNPFNPSTQIRFSLPEKSMTSLNIYNLKGQLVKTLVNADFPKGNHMVTWDGKDNNNTDVSSGVYYYRLNWNKKEMTRKMILLK